MAEEALRSTSLKANFHRLTRLLMRGGVNLLRETFDFIHSPADLPLRLADPVIRVQLRGARLTQQERNCLYPSPGMYGKSNDFDITLIFKLLRTICNLTPPPGPRGWDDLPNSSDHTLVADLVRIKYYRNEIHGHRHSMEISDTEFVRLWEEISEALLRIAANISPAKGDEWKKSIDDLLFKPLTPDQEICIEELETWYMQDLEVKNEMIKLREDIGSLRDTTAAVLVILLNVLGHNQAAGSELLLPVPEQAERADDPEANNPLLPEPEQAAGADDPETNNPPDIDVWDVILSFKESADLFLRYLSSKLHLLVRNIGKGSWHIRVECSSSQVLEGLWEDYRSGHLNSVAQEMLITPQVLEKLGRTELKLKTFISEDQYEEGKKLLKASSGAEDKSDTQSAFQATITKAFSEGSIEPDLPARISTLERENVELKEAVKAIQGNFQSERDLLGRISTLERENVELKEKVKAIQGNFQSERDYHTVTKKISVRPLEGKTLIAEQLPVCHCVQVSGFNKETTTEDTIRYFFESSKNNGGDVSSVELNLEEGWALVYFEDPKVVFNVVAGSHFLGGAKLDVSSHCSLLGRPQPVENDVELMQNINVDGKKMQFILEHYKADLTEVENSHDVQITWDEGINSVTVTPKDEALRNKYIFDEACEAITYFLAEFVESSTRVPPEAWDDVVDNFKKSKSPAQQKVRMDCIAEQHVFFFIGKKQEVEEVTKELEGIIVVIDKKLKREASKIERTVKISYTRLQFLKHLEFAQELESRHEEVEVTILLEKEKLQIRGPPETVDKVQAAIWEAVAKMKDVKLNMSLNALALLKSTPCQVFMRDTLTASNLQAMIAFDERNENVLVVGTESDVAEKAHDLVKTKIVEECVDLDEDQVQLEKSRKWHQLKEEITEKRILTLSFDRGNKKICLVGLKEDVPVSVEAVKRFLAENTIVSTVVTLPKGCRRFLVKYREPELRQIQEDLKEHSTRIKSLADEGKQDLVVSGTTCGVDKAKELIQDLASKVQSQKMPVSKPGMRKMLDGSKGKKLLGMLENENNCVVEYFLPNKGDEKEVKEEKKAEKKKESLYDLLTPDGRKILVFKDNICDRNVDVIVSAANSKLQHVGGVSKAISERAGEAFKAECNRFVTDAGPILDGQVAVTSAGNLPFKKVIHAVGPKWEKKAAQEKSMGRTPREERILSYAVTNALDAAKDYNSVAIPAISSGIFEFPLELCAEIMVESMLTFFRKNPSCLLSEIQFTSIEDDVVKAFAKELDSRCLNEPSYQSSSDSKRKRKERKKKGKTTSVPNTSSATVSSNTAPNVIKTAEGLQLVLVIGDMSSEEVDVIVNTTSSNLNLSGNASSKALSAAAGPKLQEECKKIGQVKTGEIVVTNGANLACKYVFHTSCPGWEKGEGEKVLRGIIQKCLDEAQKKSLSTISIPAIGTGNLNFPRDCVAEASFDEVLSFSKKNPSSPLKEVHLVVYDKDLQSVQAFQTELQKRSVGPPPLQPPAATAAPKDGKKKRRGLRGGSDKRSEKDTPDDVDVISDEEPILLDPLQPEITIGNIFVQAETGNITKEVTDAIATLSNNELDVALGGGVGKAILAAGGSTIQAECSAMGSQKPDTVVASRAGNLQVRKIYHMVPDYGMSMRSISNCILECLRKADSDGLTSISFPAVGTGNINKDAKEAAEGMMAAIFKFAREEPVSIALVRIVIYQPQMLSVFQTAMEASLSSAKGGTGLLSKLAGWIGLGQSGSASSHSMPSMRTFRGKAKPFSYIEIFASTKQDIDTVIKTIEKDAADHCTLKVIEREAICNLSKGQIQQVKKLEATYDVIVNIEQTIGRISVRGDTEDVLDVATTIYEELNKKIEEEHARGVGELLSKNVQWFSYDSDDDDETPEPYEPSINLQIEEAFGEGKDSVIVLIDEEKCEIVFKDMKETCLDSGEVRVVVRKEIGKGVPLPLEWDVHPKDGSGKEKEVHLVLLDPKTNEYKKVADQLCKTSPVTIVKIERVQNPGLYRTYVVRREQMDLKNGSNEKLLFHGTAGSSCPSINTFGFNRSYCGKNATAFGNGVYFARDASYSASTTYSPPDATGNRYMYLARILAGEYTTGRKGMITPPPKGSDATDVYDTVVNDPANPGIFVVFYDNQCYPDYLITFK